MEEEIKKKFHIFLNIYNAIQKTIHDCHNRKTVISVTNSI